MINESLRSQKMCNYGRPRKKRYRQGVQSTRRGAYLSVCRNDECCSATSPDNLKVTRSDKQHMDFSRGRYD
jgi:hypothetical protein